MDEEVEREKDREHATPISSVYNALGSGAESERWWSQSVWCRGAPSTATDAYFVHSTSRPCFPAPLVVISHIEQHYIYEYFRHTSNIYTNGMEVRRSKSKARIPDWGLESIEVVSRLAGDADRAPKRYASESNMHVREMHAWKIRSELRVTQCICARKLYYGQRRSKKGEDGEAQKYLCNAAPPRSRNTSRSGATGSGDVVDSEAVDVDAISVYNFPLGISLPPPLQLTAELIEAEHVHVTDVSGFWSPTR